MSGEAVAAERASVLLAKIGAERRYLRLSELLEELGRLPGTGDCTVLLPLVRHSRGRVRDGAIRALGKARGDSRAEAALLGVLADPADDYDRIYANASLGECGTAAAIPALAAQIHHARDDVKCSAIHALAQIGGAPQLPVFLDALSDRSWAAKWYAMMAIARHGSEQAIGPVCDRVRVILSRRRKISQASPSELLLALRFLARYPDDDRARATLDWVTARRLAYLKGDEGPWVRDHLLAQADGA